MIPSATLEPVAAQIDESRAVPAGELNPLTFDAPTPTAEQRALTARKSEGSLGWASRPPYTRLAGRLPRHRRGR